AGAVSQHWLRWLPHRSRHRRSGRRGPGPDPCRQPPFAGRRHAAERSRRLRPLDPRRSAHQARQPDAALRHLHRGRAEQPVALPRPSGMKPLPPADPAATDIAHRPPADPVDDLPNPLPRPEGEFAELERVWARPRGWRIVTSVNNTIIGLLYIGI